MEQEDVIYERCAGIDVHKRMIVVCLRIGRTTELRTFVTLTYELRCMTAWLKESGCQMEAMESKEPFWEPLYHIFELGGIPVMVVNAQHMKAVPGCKTDMKDAQWIAKLLSQGLLKPSFVPDREQRDMRDLTRFRKSQIEERARNLNRLQKMLEGANIKLASFVSDIDGKSAMGFLELVLGKPGFTTEDVKARRRGNMKATTEELFHSLEGIMSPVQRELFRHIIQIIREQTKQIEQTDSLIKDFMGEAYRQAAQAITELSGIGITSAQQIITEIGHDMSRFPSDGHLCKWAGVCPGNNESAGKRKSGKTGHANKTLKSTLVQCAQSGIRDKNTFFSAQYQRLVVRRGKNRAIVAVAHSMLIAIYHILKGAKFHDLGADYYTRFNREKKINAHIKQLKTLGVSIPDDVLRTAIAQGAVA